MPGRLEIDVSELLPVVVAHHVAGGLLLDGPGRREAAPGHIWLSTARKHHFVMGITECMTEQPDYVPLGELWRVR